MPFFKHEQSWFSRQSPTSVPPGCGPGGCVTRTKGWSTCCSIPTYDRHIENHSGKGQAGPTNFCYSNFALWHPTLSCHNRLGPLSFRGAKQSRAVSQLLPVALGTLQLSASPQGRWDMQQAEPRANAWPSAGLTKLRQGCCLMTQWRPRHGVESHPSWLLKRRPEL